MRPREIRITASMSTAATPSTSRCQPGTCRCISRSSTSATRPARRQLIVPITDFLSPFTQTIIETGYDRTGLQQAAAGHAASAGNLQPDPDWRWTSSTTSPRRINMALTPGRTPLAGVAASDDDS